MPLRSPRQLASDILAACLRAWANPRAVDHEAHAAAEAERLIAERDAAIIRHAVRNGFVERATPMTVTGGHRAGLICAAELRIDRVTLVGMGRVRRSMTPDPETAVALQAVAAGGSASR